MGTTLSTADISASGLAAERVRMQVIANNIANAHTTRTESGGPYQRQQVLFAPKVNDQMSLDGSGEWAGVEVVGTQPDASAFPKVYEPGHPDADADGFVLLPNVSVAMEMVDMMTASRSYEANFAGLAVIARHGGAQSGLVTKHVSTHESTVRVDGVIVKFVPITFFVN